MKLQDVLKGPNEIVPFDHPHIHYPQLASTKFDGFRCLCMCGEMLLSPKLKPIRNENLTLYLSNLMAFCEINRFVIDGELWSPTRGFHEEVKSEGISSILTTHNGLVPRDIGYYVFDIMTEEEWDNGTEQPFLNRYLNYKQLLPGLPSVHIVDQWYVNNASEAETFFNEQIENGQEGMILRSPNARYKHGRGTVNQDFLWKFKEFETFDAIIIALEERMKLKEGVERTRDVLGKLERRFEQDLYEPAGMVGAFVVELNGTRFKIKPGKGHNDVLKIKWWRDYCDYPEKWHGKHVEGKFMPHGTKDRPRIGSLVRFRPDLD